jgi:SAM-dependent methyltransferase
MGLRSVLERPRKGRRVLVSHRLGAGEFALKDYLRHSIVTLEAAPELSTYLEVCFYRLLHTLEIVPRGRGKVLELGANPYFFTLLLYRYRDYELELANYFGDREGRRGTQEIINDKYGEKHTFSYKHFNIETEKFPYEDETFDGVLFCEIIEHLTVDPVASISEIHRVLRPGGWLLLTTPNAVRRQNLVKLVRRENFYDPYSGYGPYGRHNREYTPRELRELLTGCGFSVEILRTTDLHPSSWGIRALALVMGEQSGYNLYCLARKTGEFVWEYPPWLFRSGVPTKRVESSWVAMGVNDAVQLGKGWWQLEKWPGVGPVRWTSRSAEAFLRSKGGKRLRAEIHGGPKPAAGRTVRVRVGSGDLRKTFGEAVWKLPVEVWERPEMTLASSTPAGEVSVVLEVDEVFVPSEHEDSADSRELGVAVRSLELDVEPEVMEPRNQRSGLSGSPK